MSNYYKTYKDLELFENFVDRNLKSIPDYQKFESLSHSKDFVNIFKFLLGLRFLSVEQDIGLKIFRSNRYFTDSIGVQKMPEKNEINQFYQTLEYNSLPTNYINSIIDYFINKYETRKTSSLDDIDIDIDFDFLEENGYLIIKNVLPMSLCDELAEKIHLISELEKKSEKGGYFYGSGNMQRIYHLISKDEIFQKILLHPLPHKIMSHMFHRETFHDKYYLTSFHANILSPSAESQIWHIDANVPEPIPKWIIRSNSNYIIQDYTKDNGSTQVIPGSHKWCRKPKKSEQDKFSNSEIVSIEAPKGSMVFWHGHLWHRSGENKSNKKRIALLAAYAASHFREVSMEENPYLSLSSNLSDSMDEELKQILGWDHGSKTYF